MKASETAVGPTGATVTATARTSFAVHVTDVAELPVFGPTKSWTGSEEGPITLSGLRVSGDPDDALRARISGVPAGWRVIDPGVTTIVGTSGGASGTVRAGDLGHLVVRAPDRGGESALLTLTVSNLEGAGTSAVEILTVSASAVAELPVFGPTKSWTGSEEGPITLSGLRVSHDPDDALRARISGVPAGWTVVDPGVTTIVGASGGASGTVRAGDLGHLVVRAPDRGGESALLTLTVSNLEGAGTSAVEILTVSASAVAELPVFGPTKSWTGSEEGPITLSGLRVSHDPDDALRARISGVPAGWTVVDPGVTTIVGASGGASGTVRPGDLGHLVVRAPDHGGESAVLTLTVSTLEGAGTSAVETLTVSAAAVAEAPSLAALGVSVSESTGVALTIALALTDTAFDSDDTLGPVTLSGVPGGWSLTGDGAASIGSGLWSAGAGSLGALHLVSPAGAEATSFTLGVSAGTSEGGQAATSFAVTLGDVAEAPSLGALGVSVSESTGAALTIALALTDTAFDSDDTLGPVTLSGVPGGWSLTGDGAASIGSGLWSAGAGSLGALHLVSPAGAEATSFTLGVSAGTSEGGQAATSFAVTLGDVAEAPSLGALGVSVSESTGAALTIALALTDTAFDSDDTLGPVTLSGVPGGWSLTGDGAASIGSGLWSAGAGSLGALHLVSPAGAEATSFTLGVSAGTSEGGQAATSFAVTLGDVAEAPSLGALGVSVSESTGAALTIALALTDTAFDSDDTLGPVTLSGVPGGWSLTGDGAASIGSGLWSAGAGSLGALHLVSPAGAEATSFTLGVSAGTSEGGQAATSFAVTLGDVAEAPSLGALGVSVSESTGAALTIALALTDTAFDSDDTLGPVTLSGVPGGWSLTGDGAASIGSGLWSAGAGSLGALHLVSPAGAEATSFTLGVSAGTSEGGQAATSFAVTLGDVAEAPSLGALGVSVSESTGAALTIALALTDTAFDSDDTLGPVTLSGVPGGWSLTGDGAASIGSGLWSAGAGSLGALHLVSPAGAEATSFTLGVSAGTSEGGQAATSFAVTLGDVAEAPSLGALGVSVSESTGAALTIALALTDTAFDSDDTLGPVTLSGVPGGWSLTGDGAASIGSGLWSAGAASLGALHLISPAGAEATSFTLGVSAGTSEGGQAATSFAVTLGDVAEAPSLGALGVSVSESTGAALTIALALTDTAFDSDDTLGPVTLSGVPGGWSLTGDGAASIGSGLWSAGAGSLGALHLVSPAGAEATSFTLGVSAGTSEGGQAATSFAVTLGDVAEAPSLGALGVSVSESTGAALTIALALTDTAFDSDDTLGPVTLSGVPGGWSLTGDGAASIGSGPWSAGAGSLGSLHLVSPAGAEATSFTLGVSAGTSEGGQAATSFAVTLGDVAEAPSLGALGVSVSESTGAALTIALALTDTAFDSDDTLGPVTLSGVPGGWSLTGDGAASAAPGTWIAGAASLAALELVSPGGAEETSFTIGVSASASEGGLTASAATAFGVTLSARAEAPVLAASDATVAGGRAEPNTIALTISDTVFDSDDTLGNATISGVPSGWSLNHGTTSGNASTWIETPAQLSGLAIIAPGGTENRVVTLGVTATATESGASNTATTSTTLRITINAEAPVLRASNATVGESTAANGIALSITDTKYDGDDTLGAVTLTGVPARWSLNHGTTGGNASTWIETPAQLSGLKLIAPANTEATSFTLGVTATATEAGASGPATATTSLAVTVTEVAEAPNLTVHDSDCCHLHRTVDHRDEIRQRRHAGQRDGFRQWGECFSPMDAERYRDAELVSRRQRNAYGTCSRRDGAGDGGNQGFQSSYRDAGGRCAVDGGRRGRHGDRERYAACDPHGRATRRRRWRPDQPGAVCLGRHDPCA